VGLVHRRLPGCHAPRRGEGSFGILAYGSCGYTNRRVGRWRVVQHAAALASSRDGTKERPGRRPLKKASAQQTLAPPARRPAPQRPRARSDGSLPFPRAQYAASADANPDYPGAPRRMRIQPAGAAQAAPASAARRGGAPSPRALARAAWPPPTVSRCCSGSLNRARMFPGEPRDRAAPSSSSLSPRLHTRPPRPA
jgi:hypothetical protein